MLQFCLPSRPATRKSNTKKARLQGRLRTWSCVNHRQPDCYQACTHSVILFWVPYQSFVVMEAWTQYSLIHSRLTLQLSYFVLQVLSSKNKNTLGADRGGAREQQRGVRHFIVYVWYSSKHGKKMKVIRDCNFLLGAAAPTGHNVAPPLGADIHRTHNPAWKKKCKSSNIHTMSTHSSSWCSSNNKLSFAGLEDDLHGLC